jgi:hypothetical protein
MNSSQPSTPLSKQPSAPQNVEKKEGFFSNIGNFFTGKTSTQAQTSSPAPTGGRRRRRRTRRHYGGSVTAHTPDKGVAANASTHPAPSTMKGGRRRHRRSHRRSHRKSHRRSHRH